MALGFQVLSLFFLSQHQQEERCGAVEIEGKCCHLVYDRFERSGMHWSPDGAQTMLDIVLSDQWQDLYRSQEQHTSGLIPGQRVA